MKISFILFCICATIPGISQNLRIFGKVLAAGSGSPVEFAIVSVLTANDSLIDGQLSQSNEDFLLENIHEKNLKNRIQYIGYDAFLLPLTIKPSQLNYDLGNIRLKLNNQV